MHSRELESKKSSLRLTRLQREVLVGIILGDAHLETRNNGRTYRVKFEYSAKQCEYVEHLYEIFKEWVLTSPQEKIDALLLLKGPGFYPINFWLDNYPLGGKVQEVRIPTNLIDEQYFVKLFEDKNFVFYLVK